jgi:hypothetical protein
VAAGTARAVKLAATANTRAVRERILEFIRLLSFGMVIWKRTLHAASRRHAILSWHRDGAKTRRRGRPRYVALD